MSRDVAAAARAARHHRHRRGGAVRRRGHADRRPRRRPHRRAEAASYFSVAVFGGLGVGRSSARPCSATTTSTWRSSSPAAFAVLAAVLSLARARTSVRAGRRTSRTDTDDPSSRPRPLHPPGGGRPGLVLAPALAAFSVFTAFLPDHARAVGFGGSGGLFAGLQRRSASCCASSAPRARAPRPPPRGHDRVRLARRLACCCSPRARAVGAVGRGGRDRRRHGVHVPVADGAHRQPRRRPRARAALSSFTMFFEIGTVSGGLALGARRRAVGKRAGSPAASCCCAVGRALLWRGSRVPPPARRARRAASTRPRRRRLKSGVSALTPRARSDVRRRMRCPIPARRRPASAGLVA